VIGAAPPDASQQRSDVAFRSSNVQVKVRGGLQANAFRDAEPEQSFAKGRYIKTRCFIKKRCFVKGHGISPYEKNWWA